jgi:hypothetical protein
LPVIIPLWSPNGACDNSQGQAQRRPWYQCTCTAPSPVRARETPRNPDGHCWNYVGYPIPHAYYGVDILRGRTGGTNMVSPESPRGTYKNIQAWVKSQTGRSVKTCWIADAKEKFGLKPRVAHNRKHPDRRLDPCPEDLLDILRRAFEHFNMLGRRKS